LGEITARIADALARKRARLAEALARRRVALGFVAAAGAFLLARPTWRSLAIGCAVAAVGECLRVWAAGHLEKGREVTRSGPYRWMRHPLYVGSAVMAIGVVIAARHPLAALVAALYVGSTIPAAIRREEAFLRHTFGDTYDQYARAESEPMARRFSLDRARRNREYRAVLGLLAGFALLALKLLRPI
jgi:protein-S-isoprenylcysteine O-methyltransferase Ste14